MQTSPINKIKQEIIIIINGWQITYNIEPNFGILNTTTPSTLSKFTFFDDIVTLSLSFRYAITLFTLNYLLFH